jgi:hypothetical protein
MGGRQPGYILQGNFVIADDLGLPAQFPQVLGQIVNKRIIIIDN